MTASWILSGNNTSAGKSESRRHHRVNVNPGMLNDPMFTAVNISESGIKLHSSNQQTKGARISLTLKVKGEMMELVGQVMWSKKASSIFEEGYYTGLAFTGHTFSQQMALRKFIEEQAG